PNADRLQLCQVDVGNPDPQQIVCGAWNFGAGATVAVGLPGAVLPGFPRPLVDRVLDVTPTMNRPDLLSMVGIAREVAALCDGELRLPDPKDPPPVAAEPLEIVVDDFAGCPRYIGRAFRNVRVGPSP